MNIHNKGCYTVKLKIFADTARPPAGKTKVFFQGKIFAVIIFAVRK
jgi:hypothetical protein